MRQDRKKCRKASCLEGGGHWKVRRKKRAGTRWTEPLGVARLTCRCNKNTFFSRVSLFNRCSDASSGPAAQAVRPDLLSPCPPGWAWRRRPVCSRNRLSETASPLSRLPGRMSGLRGRPQSGSAAVPTARWRRSDSAVLQPSSTPEGNVGLRWQLAWPPPLAAASTVKLTRPNMTAFTGPFMS